MANSSTAMVPLFSDFKYQQVRSNMKDYAEVVVSYKFRGKDARRIIYLRSLEHEGGSKFYTEQAEKQIEKEIRNDYLYHHSKRYMRLNTFYGLKILSILILLASVATIIALVILKYYLNII